MLRSSWMLLGRPSLAALRLASSKIEALARSPGTSVPAPDDAFAAGDVQAPDDAFAAGDVQAAMSFFRIQPQSSPTTSEPAAALNASSFCMSALAASVRDALQVRSTKEGPPATDKLERRVLLAVFQLDQTGTPNVSISVFDPRMLRQENIEGGVSGLIASLKYIAADRTIAGDAWTNCMALATALGAAPRGVIIPVVWTADQQKVSRAAGKALGELLAQNGVGFSLEVDTMDLISSLWGSKQAAGNSDVRAAGPGRVDDALEAAQSAWSILSALCARVRPGVAPLDTLTFFSAPVGKVYVVSLWTFGGRTDHLVLLDPLTRSRRHSSGSMAEILHELLSIPSPAVIFVPTTRTDRAILLAVCSALQKQGKTTSIVFPSDIIPASSTEEAQNGNTRAVQQPKGIQKQLATAAGVSGDANNPYDYLFENEAEKLLVKLQQVEGLSMDELLWRIAITSGAVNRRVAKLASQRAAAEAESVFSTTSSGLGDQQQTVTENRSPLDSPAAWLDYYLSRPERKALEVSVADSIAANPLFVSFTATEDPFFERPSNPSAQENCIVCAAFDDATKKPLLPLQKWRTRKDFDLPSLDDVSVIVTYDAKSFLLLAQASEDLEKYLRRGGKVWCVALAEYLLSSQRIRKPNNSLEQIAARYSHILSLEQLPLQRTRNNLMNDDLAPLQAFRTALGADVAAIRAIFYGQIEQAGKQMQVQSITFRMDALLAFFSMEKHGIYIDRARANEIARQNRNKCITVESMLNAFIPRAIPLDQQHRFFWSDYSHVGSYYFGGEFKFSQSDLSVAHDSTRAQVPFLYWFGDLSLAAGMTEANLKAFVSRFRLSSGPHEESAAAAGDSAGPAAPSPSQGSRLFELIRTAKEICSMKDFFFRQNSIRVVFFDVESTGLNALSDAIVEIALVDPFCRVASRGSFSSLVNPERPIPREATLIHGISNAMVSGAPTRREVASKLASFLRLTEETQQPGEMVVMLSHATFSLDQPLLLRMLHEFCPEADTSRLLFADSLKLFRLIKDGLLSDEKNSSSNTKTSGKKKAAPQSKGSSSSAPGSPDRLIRRAASMKLEGIADALRVKIPRKALHSALGDAQILASCVLRTVGFSDSQAQSNPGKARNAVLALVGAAATRSAAVLTAPDAITLGTRIAGTLEHGPLAVTPRQLQRLRKQNLDERFLLNMTDRGCPVAPLLLKLRKLERLNDKLLLCDPQGMLRVLHPDNVTRQCIELTSTVTSRTTSVYPSCQNIPKDDPTMIRRIFASRFGSDGLCVEIDYSQLEIVVMANLCGDRRLAAELNSGKDFHCARAAMYCGMSYDQLVAGYKNGDKKATTLRKQAKIFTFQRLYGAGADLIHRTTKLPKETISKMIEDEEAKYPQMKRFVDLVRATAARPENPGLPTQLVFELPTGLRVGFKPIDVMRNMPPVKNYPIQGFGAEVAQIMLGRVGRFLLGNDFYGQRCFLTNFVHDSLWFDVHRDVADEATTTIAQMLSDAHIVLPQFFPGLELPVPLTVSISRGLDMRHQEKVVDNHGAPSSDSSSNALNLDDEVFPSSDDAAESENDEEED
jgi:DNA polymerase-1